MNAPAAACLEEDTLLAFAGGALSSQAIAGLEAHVDDCAACRAAMHEAVGRRARRQPRARPLPVSSFAPGDELVGRYRITRFLAQGGMGEVYQADDLVLGEHVALKVVAAAIADDPKALARLRAEVQLTRRINHPNVCRMFDIGAAPAGPFLTMELLVGETLGARVSRQGRLGTAEILALLPQLAAGLDAAHEVGVVHRDLKSDNVMLCPRTNGAVDRVVVMDFGLARSLLVDPDRPPLTTGKNAIGTVAYMAPEQVLGSRNITPAADIYALGVLLYELLTGALPFAGATPVAVALDRLARLAPSPSARVPDLHPCWERALARCLEREPAARFASGRELVAALQA